MKIGSFKGSMIAAALGAALGWSPSAILAAVIPVTNLTDSGPGSLRAAIALAATGDTVDATGIAGTVVLASELVVDKSLTIQGPGQNLLVLSGNQATRVLHLSQAGSTVQLSGLTVANGTQTFDPVGGDNDLAAGGIFNRANLTLSHCLIRGNSVAVPNPSVFTFGGGIASLGRLTVTHCTVTENENNTPFGGGIAARSFDPSVTATIAYSTLHRNSPDGVAVDLPLHISRSTISENPATGIYTSRPIFTVDQTFTVDQCTVSGNGEYGLLVGAAGRIVNSSIVGNRYGIGANSNTGAGVIGNTLFANGKDFRIARYPLTNDKHPISLGHNITLGDAGAGDGLTSPGGWLNQPTDRRNTDPLLGPLQNNGGPTLTHAPLAGSPAIDAGGLDEVQDVWIRGSSGTFTLTFNGQTTGALPFDATPAQVQAALNALSSIGGVGGSVGVARNLDEAGNNVLVVSFFGGTLGGLDLPQMTASASGGASVLWLRTLSDGGGVPALDQRGFPRPVGQLDIGALEKQLCDTPTVTLTGPASGAVFAVNTPVTFTASFTGENAPHTATWSIDGNLVPGVVDENSQTVTATVTFTSAGVYPVQLTVANDCGNNATSDTLGELPAQVVIYDPSAGFVTGGGWINSPAGAANWVGGENLTGRASFGFVSRYQKGAKVPTGQTEFQFKAGGLNFKSTSYQWLVVSGARAQYKGEGTVNGVPGYGFLLTAIDGQISGGGGADKFRIKIWNSGGVVYDNQMGADDSAAPSIGLGGGSIVIHQ